MRLIDRWDHIFSVNKYIVGFILGVLPCFTNDALILRKIVSLVMGGFICRPFRGNSRSRNFGLLVNQIFCQKCKRQADSGCSCLRSTLHCCSSPDAERSSIQHVSVCSPRLRLICFINFQETVCVIPADNWIYPPLVSEPAAFFWWEQIPAPLFPSILWLSCRKHKSNPEDLTEKTLICRQ